MQPGLRRALGGFGILAFLAAYVIGVGALSGAIGALPVWAQALIYAVAGVAWVFPLRPVFVWMRGPR